MYFLRMGRFFETYTVQGIEVLKQKFQMSATKDGTGTVQSSQCAFLNLLFTFLCYIFCITISNNEE